MTIIKILVPGTDLSLKDRPGSLSDLEQALQGDQYEQALESALSMLDGVEAKLHLVAAAGLPPADYAVLKTLKDACQAARETLKTPLRFP